MGDSRWHPSRREALAAAGFATSRATPRGYAAALATVLAVVSAHPARAQRPAFAQHLDTVPVRAERVTDGVYVLRGSGGNITVAVGPDGALLVDAGFEQQGPKVVAAVRALTDRPIRYVVDTHFHFDHAEGNAALAVSDTVTAYHVPRAHTDGDAVVHFRRANVVAMGDLFMAPTRYPYLQLEAGGSIEGLIAGVERALAVSDARTRVVPGHGPVVDRAALQTYRDVLVTVRDRVRRRVDAGATLQAVLAGRPSAEFDAGYGTGLVNGPRFVEAVYRSLTRR
jgi:glyoxylase-like metal-dependent hydrolase (beta-lactamase superfamily II)